MAPKRQTPPDATVTAEAAYDAALAAWRGSCRHREQPAASPPLLEGCAACATYRAACEAFLKSAGALNTAGDCHLTGRQAVCAGCGQSFNPRDAGDLIHLVTTVPRGRTWGPDYTGHLPEGPERYCGGRGEMTGGWI